MKVDPVQGSTPREDNPSRRESRRAGAGRGDRQPNSGNASERSSDWATPRLGLSTSPGTAAGERRRATISTPAEGLIYSRTRTRTRLAATISARSSGGGRGRQLFTGLFRGVSPHQPTIARMESSATYSQPPQSLPEQPPDTPGASQPPTTELVSPLTTPLALEDSSTSVIEGAPLTGDPPFPLGGSSSPVIKGAPQTREIPPQTSGPAQAPIFESRPPQPASRGKFQSSIHPSLAISVLASNPPTTPQLSSATSPSARPPTTSSPSPPTSLPPPAQLPTTGHPSTATPMLTSSAVPALETPSQTVVRTSEAASPTPSRTMPTRTVEGRGPAPVPTPDLPPSSPRTPSPTPTETSSGRNSRKTAVYAMRH